MALFLGPRAGPATPPAGRIVVFVVDGNASAGQLAQLSTAFSSILSRCEEVRLVVGLPCVGLLCGPGPCMHPTYACL